MSTADRWRMRLGDGEPVHLSEILREVAAELLEAKGDEMPFTDRGERRRRRLRWLARRLR